MNRMAACSSSSIEASPLPYLPPLLEHHLLAEPHGVELQGHLPLLPLGLLLPPCPSESQSCARA
jgi:hypothetical protein